jgi:hypothetical protein
MRNNIFEETHADTQTIVHWNITNNLPKLGLKTFYQRSITTSGASTVSNEQAWGDTIGKKEEGVLRIACRNINSMPMSASNSKNLELVEDMKVGEIDLIGLSEVNISWRHLPPEDQYKERFRGCFESLNIVLANNQDKEHKERRQLGGNAILTP